MYNDISGDLIGFTGENTDKLYSSTRAASKLDNIYGEGIIFLPSVFICLLPKPHCHRLYFV